MQVYTKNNTDLSVVYMPAIHSLCLSLVTDEDSFFISFTNYKKTNYLQLILDFNTYSTEAV